MRREPTGLMHSAVPGGPVPSGLSRIPPNAFSNPVSSGSVVQCTSSAPAEPGLGSAPLGFGQSLSPWEATLGSRAQNIFHLALVKILLVLVFFPMVLTEIWYKGYPKYCLTSLTGTRLFSSLPVSVLKPRRGYVCLQNITHTRGKKEYRRSHWCPINK